MTQSPPPPGYPNPPQQPFQPGPPASGPRTNGWAIASLICGLLGCIPGIASLLAIVFGIVGVKKANEPQTSGKGIAITGIVLGLVGLLLWAGCGGSAFLFYRSST